MKYKVYVDSNTGHNSKCLQESYRVSPRKVQVRAESQ